MISKEHNSQRASYNNRWGSDKQGDSVSQVLHVFEVFVIISPSHPRPSVHRTCLMPRDQHLTSSGLQTELNGERGRLLSKVLLAAMWLLLRQARNQHTIGWDTRSQGPSNRRISTLYLRSAPCFYVFMGVRRKTRSPGSGRVVHSQHILFFLVQLSGIQQGIQELIWLPATNTNKNLTKKNKTKNCVSK